MQIHYRMNRRDKKKPVRGKASRTRPTTKLAEAVIIQLPKMNVSRKIRLSKGRKSNIHLFGSSCDTSRIRGFRFIRNWGTTS